MAHFFQLLWRILFGLALLPWCVGATWALMVLIRSSGGSSLFWVSVLGGVAAWLVVFLMLPKPLWIYVVGHELTHALSAWICGGRVKAFRATSRGGSVVVSKTNPFIVLAPYFIPLYALIWAAFWGVGSHFGHWQAYQPWFHFGLGVTYSFHVTLTVHILRVRQPDIDVEGWIVSGVLIWLGNVLVLLVTLPWLTGRVTPWTALGWWLNRTARFLMWLASAF